MEALTRRLQVSIENVLPAYNAETASTEPAGYILPFAAASRRPSYAGRASCGSLGQSLWS